MRLGDRLLQYAETVITLSRALEETKENIRDIRGGMLQNRERIIRVDANRQYIPKRFSTCSL